MNIYIKLFQYLAGSLKIEIKGDFSERFFNILAAERIKFWGIEKVNGNFTFYCFKKDFLRLKALRKKAFVKIKILSKAGFPVLLKKYRKRYGIVVGIALFFLLINLASTRIWLVKVNGDEIFATKENVIAALEELNVKSGVGKKEINTDLIKQQLLLASDNLSWASLNVQGSVLEVNVQEFNKKEAINKTPCNLIAATDGIIKKLNVRSGKCVVSIGQTVIKGEVLVSGIKTEKGVNSFIVSEGEVYASVPDDVIVEIHKNESEKVYNNNNKSRYVLEVMTLKIPLFLGDYSETYDKVVTQKFLKLFGNEVPIKVYKQRIMPYEAINISNNKETAIKKAKIELEKIMSEQNATEFNVISSAIFEDSEKFIITFNIRKTVNIANKDFFKINSEN